MVLMILVDLQHVCGPRLNTQERFSKTQALRYNEMAHGEPLHIHFFSQPVDPRNPFPDTNLLCRAHMRPHLVTFLLCKYFMLHLINSELY